MGGLSDPCYIWHELVGLTEVGVVLVVLDVQQDLLVVLTLVVLLVLLLIMPGLSACSNPLFRR